MHGRNHTHLFIHYIIYISYFGSGLCSGTETYFSCSTLLFRFLLTGGCLSRLAVRLFLTARERGFLSLLNTAYSGLSSLLCHSSSHPTAFPTPVMPTPLNSSFHFCPLTLFEGNISTSLTDTHTSHSLKAKLGIFFPWISVQHNTHPSPLTKP